MYFIVSLSHGPGIRIDRFFEISFLEVELLALKYLFLVIIPYLLSHREINQECQLIEKFLDSSSVRKEAFAFRNCDHYLFQEGCAKSISQEIYLSCYKIPILSNHDQNRFFDLHQTSEQNTCENYSLFVSLQERKSFICVFIKRFRWGTNFHEAEIMLSTISNHHSLSL